MSEKKPPIDTERDILKDIRKSLNIQNRLSEEQNLLLENLKFDNKRLNKDLKASLNSLTSSLSNIKDFVDELKNLTIGGQSETGLSQAQIDDDKERKRNAEEHARAEITKEKIFGKDNTYEHNPPEPNTEITQPVKDAEKGKKTEAEKLKEEMEGKALDVENILLASAKKTGMVQSDSEDTNKKPSSDISNTFDAENFWNMPHDKQKVFLLDEILKTVKNIAENIGKTGNSSTTGASIEGGSPQINPRKKQKTGHGTTENNNQEKNTGGGSPKIDPRRKQPTGHVSLDDESIRKIASLNSSMLNKIAECVCNDKPAGRKQAPAPKTSNIDWKGILGAAAGTAIGALAADYMFGDGEAVDAIGETLSDINDFAENLPELIGGALGIGAGLIAGRYINKFASNRERAAINRRNASLNRAIDNENRQQRQQGRRGNSNVHTRSAMPSRAKLAEIARNSRLGFNTTGNNASSGNRAGPSSQKARADAKNIKKRRSFATPTTAQRQHLGGHNLSAGRRTAGRTAGNTAGKRFGAGMRFGLGGIFTLSGFALDAHMDELQQTDPEAYSEKMIELQDGNILDQITFDRFYARNHLDELLHGIDDVVISDTNKNEDIQENNRFMDPRWERGRIKIEDMQLNPSASAMQAIGNLFNTENHGIISPVTKTEHIPDNIKTGGASPHSETDMKENTSGNNVFATGGHSIVSHSGNTVIINNEANPLNAKNTEGITTLERFNTRVGF